jgi:hypothetical protein
LRRKLGDASITYEEFYTLLRRIEACLNSRPLIPLSQDLNDLEALTFGHFLIGAPLTAPYESDRSQHQRPHEVATDHPTPAVLLEKVAKRVSVAVADPSQRPTTSTSERRRRGLGGLNRRQPATTSMETRTRSTRAPRK